MKYRKNHVHVFFCYLFFFKRKVETPLTDNKMYAKTPDGSRPSGVHRFCLHGSTRIFHSFYFSDTDGTESGTPSGIAQKYLSAAFALLPLWNASPNGTYFSAVFLRFAVTTRLSFSIIVFWYCSYYYMQNEG